MNALEVTCPLCKAQPGDACMDGLGIHQARSNRAKEPPRDDGASRFTTKKPCCFRMPDERHCILDDNHPGDHDGPPPRVMAPNILGKAPLV